MKKFDPNDIFDNSNTITLKDIIGQTAFDKVAIHDAPTEEFDFDKAHVQDTAPVIFSKFLKERKVFKKFTKNACWTNSKEELSFFQGYFHEAEYWIDKAFNWEGTPEGYVFWSDISNKWRIYLNERS